MLAEKWKCCLSVLLTKSELLSTGYVITMQLGVSYAIINKKDKDLDKLLK